MFKELKNIKLCLAPLAGVTSLPVREFFSYLGADLTHTEMISCSGLIRDNKKTFDMLKISEKESPVIIQLFAPDENVLIQGAEKVLKIHEHTKNFFGLGINMACPMPKITKGGSGSALLKKPETAFKMVKGLKDLNSKIPVWVKIRKLENDNDTLNFIKVLIDAGADNICIHGRTQAQRYEGKSDKNIISLSSKEFPDYISASGDVWTVEDINEYINMGVSCIMLARGAIANLWLFCEFKGIKKSLDEKFEDVFKLAALTNEYSGEHKAVITLKRFSLSLFKGTEGSAEIRNKICQSSELNEIIKIIENNKII